mmetsp:Transcript_2108/g.2899  ORF Transcript_2108/g.2899 Transcript_2108/m.2899 type:complete len:286 (-) Transcript_2108:97-954(-)
MAQASNVIVRPRPIPRNVDPNTNNNPMTTKHSNHAKHSDGYIPFFVPLGETQPDQTDPNAMTQGGQLALSTTGEIPLAQATQITQTQEQTQEQTHVHGNAMANSQFLSSNMALNQQIKTQSQFPLIEPLGSVQQTPPRTTVYYYDASVTTSGNLIPPKLVYDENGNAIPLAQLQSLNADIFLEPPSLGAARSPNQQTLSVSQVEQMAMQPPAQDQFIIIATVAVMALLVGALSARRLRSRQFLSSCIENESLEDEVAYDQAYTLNHGGDYSTFGNWKGDLEKFDV